MEHHGKGCHEAGNEAEREHAHGDIWQFSMDQIEWPRCGENGARRNVHQREQADKVPGESDPLPTGATRSKKCNEWRAETDQDFHVATSQR